MFSCKEKNSPGPDDLKGEFLQTLQREWALTNASNLKGRNKINHFMKLHYTNIGAIQRPQKKTMCYQSPWLTSLQKSSGNSRKPTSTSLIEDHIPLLGGIYSWNTKMYFSYITFFIAKYGERPK